MLHSFIFGLVLALPMPVAGETPTLPGAWHGVEGVDLQIISTGEVVDLKDHLEPQHFTVFDFGAPWCGPCKITAAVLTQAMHTHTDLAVRAIELNAPTAHGSFELPAARQHLRFVAGLPWLIVHDPNGKRIYKGPDVNAALEEIGARRPTPEPTPEPTAEPTL